MQRRALGVLFCVSPPLSSPPQQLRSLGAGTEARGWIVAIAALALAGWLGSVGLSALPFLRKSCSYLVFSTREPG